MKKLAAVLLSAVVTVGSTTTSMAAITFSDINNVPWDGAKNYVAKVAALGLMVGEENGDGTSLFRARDKVTYCETVQLAYNILKNQGKAKSSIAVIAKWKSVMSGYKIPEWAHEAVSYALENQVINITDLSGFMTSSGANNNATREDVAVIFGRALSSDYPVESKPVLTFADKSTVSTIAVPYVNLLSKLNILIGDDNKNFNPKNFINRAEMAVVTTKTYSVVSGEKINVDDSSVTGTINYMTSEKITVNLKGGGTALYPLATNVSVLLNNKEADISKITKMIDNGVTVDVVIKLSNGTATAVSASGLEDTVQGTILKISSDEVTIKRTGGSSKTYACADYLTIRYEGEISRISKIQDIMGSSNELYVTATLNDEYEIEKVVITVSELGGNVKGFLKNVTDKKIVVSISDSKIQTYSISTDPIVTYEGEEITYDKLIDKFEAGTDLTATVYFDSSRDVSKIEAKLEDNNSGVITKLTDTYITIFTNAGISRKCLLDEDVIIKFNGGTTESVSYLNSIYETGKTQVTLTFNKNDEVVKVLVDLDQDSYARISGEINKMGSDSMVIGAKTVYFSSGTAVKIDEEESSTALLYKGWQSGEAYDATVSYADGVAKNISAKLIGAEGKVYSLKTGEIVLSTDAGIRNYKITDDENLTIRIDGTKKVYNFRDFYSLWYVNNNNYSVILTIEDGLVVRINATTL